MKEEFKDNVTKILELTDAENWDGVEIKNKEEEIRNIALIYRISMCSNYERIIFLIVR